ncbi:dihydroceramide fatty acyl 2-hydroxylase FAH2 isoform X1 [Physcomitrium patens]|uniref:Fatty acid 2-hydroxylase n=2 Tax=Physcomitrium patens TaxID=3218 RepID=A0A2K1JJA6_PHYPA|nr:dihydroceramide fatty acyl 2-hydroxylase FAH2-like isoform X1 [Physcomitrium patens]PNR41630.1 hypothetical protein PHYPA_019035 [Physcomitrium patens]|eukprot:XP_024393781.1 dihydroceramide fatty acyl 2-hydroxylase FAH2-like isoform X1 [Physcomitrella patens]
MESEKAAEPASKLDKRNAVSGVTFLEIKNKNLEDETVLTNEEISKHKNENDAWVVVDGIVYDISQFVQAHPGGAEKILKHLHLEDVGKLMRGDEVASSESHSHSKHAFRTLQQFRIGRVSDYNRGEDMSESTRPRREERKYVVDLDKPLVFQVGKLGAEYDQWVHNPIVQKDPPRFFESDVAEFFTKTACWAIPAVWGPVVMCLAVAAHKDGLQLSAAPFFMASGAFVWTLIEYILHRYLFHMKTSGYWTNTLHYFLHGFHHKHPMDGTRLVFPPVIAGIILVAIWFVTEPLVIFLGRPAKLSMFSGGLLMYIAYDLTHYFLHFGTPTNEMSRKLKRLHFDHHFKDQSTSFGVTTHFWDKVFDTFPSFQTRF